MACNIDELTFDFSGTAGLYSQMTGVLAGFAFGAITLVLSKESYRRNQDAADNERDEVNIILALVAAFMSLLVTTLEFAVLAGERGCSLVEGRAASEEFLGGVAFAFSALLLLYAVVRLVSHYGAPRTASHVCFIVALLGPPLAVLFLMLGAEDVAFAPWRRAHSPAVYQPQRTAFSHRLEIIAYPLPVLPLVLCLAVWVISRRMNVGRPNGDTRPEKIGHLAFPYTSLALVVAAEIRSTMLAETNPHTHITEPEVWAWLTSCVVVLLLQTLHLSVGQRHPV